MPFWIFVYNGQTQMYCCPWSRGPGFARSLACGSAAHGERIDPAAKAGSSYRGVGERDVDRRKSFLAQNYSVGTADQLWNRPPGEDVPVIVVIIEPDSRWRCHRKRHAGAGGCHRRGVLSGAASNR